MDKQTFLAASTTVPTTSSVLDLSPGWWEFTLVTADSSASIAVNSYEDSADATALPVAKDGTAIALTSADPKKAVYSSGARFSVTRTGGSGAATVTAKPMPKFS